jgi:hypothetical protein
MQQFVMKGISLGRLLLLFVFTLLFRVVGEPKIAFRSAIRANWKPKTTTISVKALDVEVRKIIQKKCCVAFVEIIRRRPDGTFDYSALSNGSLGTLPLHFSIVFI